MIFVMVLIHYFVTYYTNGGNIVYIFLLSIKVNSSTVLQTNIEKIQSLHSLINNKVEDFLTFISFFNNC